MIMLNRTFAVYWKLGVKKGQRTLSTGH